MSELSPTKLIEKIVRAKVKLENSKMNHKDSCPVESDPEGYAPCNCGASKTNGAIDAAIRELNID
ncbi:MAG: hypothetical protein A3B86_04145 [Candidatus Yanofskybacteria bacterium RIFCSPHIGHO2_02_FULL_38_22b]|uniref:Uncharacterized protein n=1 Tax=Candidatus Yanofskybacteria bacterium RIFCSPHIGHO2_02_FULL_38_22b TaxID=1802673 RepID=A0A1F8EZH3_9BACT|nr:MAG: hypothetical protein A3B86_04145 [Candidatus Yanofskybacteria bacterium RIFCSPHIGHO2_02_FULL_38_22b]OGN19701.1 MAG: hypothetical protein A2910_03880 [Candidatus Yanofskybacteria bacterium RIFCSPLOWO2_01_FULL_39_28]